MNTIFSQDFLNISDNEISNEISECSFFSKKSVISKDLIKNMLDEINLFEIKLNSLEISSVHDQDGYYMSNGLAKSKTLFDLLTSEKIMNISKSYMGEKFRLKCHRVYSVSSGAKNPWHTDDKKYGIKNQNIKGLVFIIYLNDVYNGEFQAIKGSHLFSEDFNHPNFDTNIIKNYKDKIVSFKMPAGSIIIFDNKSIHRAKPYIDFFWRRKSLFFQIDNEVEDGEKIIVNTKFLNELDKNKSQLLGVGKKSDMPHEPSKTGLNTLNLKTIIRIQLSLFSAIYKRIYFSLKFFVSDQVKRKIQSFFGKKTKVNSE